MSTSRIQEECNPISCNFCSVRRKRLSKVRTEEKMIKPTNQTVESLRHSYNDFMADAKGLRDYERRKVYSDTVSLNGKHSDEMYAVKNMYAQRQVRPSLKPLYGDNSFNPKDFDSNNRSKRKNNSKCKKHTTSKNVTVVTKSSSLSNLMYPVKNYNTSNSGIDYVNVIQKKGKKKKEQLYEAIGVDRIYRLKSQERIVINANISIKDAKENLSQNVSDSTKQEELLPKSSPMSCNSPFPHEIITRARADSNISLRDTRFTPSFANMPPNYHSLSSSPDDESSAEVFQWNGENVLLAPSVSNNDIQTSRFSTSNNNLENEKDENGLSFGTVELRNSFVRCLNFELPRFVNELKKTKTDNIIEVSPREEDKDELNSDTKSQIKRKNISCNVVAYTPPLQDENIVKRERKHANKGHVLSQLRLLQLAINDENL